MNGAGLRGLGEEQAALRRVATLVARGVPAGELFRAVTEEVRRVLSTEYAHLIRYGPAEAATVLAAFGRTDDILPAGTQLKLGGSNATTLASTVVTTSYTGPDASSGRAALNLTSNGQNDFVMYLVSPQRALILNVNPAMDGSLNQQ